MTLTEQQIESGLRMQVAEALAECQFLERELKSCIGSAIALARKKGDTTPLNLRIPQQRWNAVESSLARCPLKPLATHFEEITTDQKLIADIKAFTVERNFLAHEALTDHYYPDGSLDHQSVEKIGVRVSKIKAEAKRLAAAVDDETRKWIAHLWFDPIVD